VEFNNEYRKFDYGSAKKRSRRIILLLRVLFKEFRGFLIVLALAVSTSICMLYFFYPRNLLPNGAMTLAQAGYYTLLMIFFESPLTYVEDLHLAPLFFILPIVGLVTIAEGVVHLGNLLFQHKRYSKEWRW
jgi:hypothetical protein